MEQVRSQSGPAGTVAGQDREPLSEASYVAGIAAAISIVVPLGLVATPFAGIAAIVLGIIGMPAAQGRSRQRAVIGITLGAIALAVSIPLLFLARHVLWRLLVDSGNW